MDRGRAVVASRHRGRGRPRRGSDARLRLRQHPDDLAAQPVGDVEAGARCHAAPRAAGPPGAGRARPERGRHLVVPAVQEGRAFRRRRRGPAPAELDRRHARHDAALDPAQPDRRGVAQRGARPRRSGAVRGRPAVQGCDAAGPAHGRRRHPPSRGGAAQLGGPGPHRRRVRRQGRCARRAGRHRRAGHAVGPVRRAQLVSSRPLRAR